MNTGDHFREALLGGGGGGGSGMHILPRENFEILVLFGGI